ncbi:MAG: hypothetical protein H6700_11670 [Myxococcales bacterium]|nr:hypothetical protein [Myxococcales bacterium]MCB9521611.1 hypothetical protein [Myxococcales bacterium]MCB9532417.1 hypothetical protein [Myxococcales bacterium]
MDLHQQLLALVAPLRIGDELLPGVRFDGTSTELGLRYRFDLGDDRLWVDVGPIDRVRRYAARSGRLGFGYRTEGGRTPHASTLGRTICVELAARVAENEARVLDGVAELAAAEAPLDARVRSVTVATALETSGLGDARFYTLNPYIGCVIGCRFCYAQTPIASTRALVGLGEYDWGAYVEVRSNLAEVLEGELASLPPMPIKVSPIVSDAYHGIEKRERVTRRCFETIARSERPWVPMVLTRSTLILRDLDVFARLPQAWVGVSIPTIDDSVRAHFEPRAASVEERLEVLAQFRDIGVNTFAVVQPMMWGSAEGLAAGLAGRVRGVVLDLLAEEEGATADFDDPRFSATREKAWQLDQAQTLRAELERRGVPVWVRELPPEVCGGRA